jgi:hypothetical protein
MAPLAARSGRLEMPGGVRPVLELQVAARFIDRGWNRIDLT